MADITIRIGWDMIRCFARGYRAVMAGATATCHFIVIYFSRRCPAIGAMTGITGIAGLNVFCALTLRRGAIMTT